MKIGIVGLGKMGCAIAQRLIQAHYEVVGFDIYEEAKHNLTAVGGKLVDSVVSVASDTRIIWLMVPAGTVVDQVINELMLCMQPGTLVIDGGNSNFSDSIRRADHLQASGFEFLDCGTSGGIHGLEQGFCLMVGGNYRAFMQVKGVFESIAVPGGVGYMGPSGAGHYVKMVHNGIEYALLQAYAEGMHVIKEGAFKDAHIDLASVAQVWNNGSVIRSWILELLHGILVKDQELRSISGKVNATGMGKWTVQEARRMQVPAEMIELAVRIREKSQQDGGNYATKLVALLRNAFGGHSFEKI